MVFDLKTVMILCILFALFLVLKKKVAAKITFLLISVSLLAMLLPIFLIDIYPWITSPNPPEPKLQELEFPFMLEYISGDSLITIEDSLICKYDGLIYNDATSKKERVWASAYSSGNKDIVLLKCNTKTIYNEVGEITGEGDYDIVIYLYPGLAAYYMGEVDGTTLKYPVIYYEIKENGCKISSQGIYGADIFDSPLLAAYGIKIINWEIASPIENSFERQGDGSSVLTN